MCIRDRYNTEQLGMTDFYTVCFIKGVGVEIGKGHGRSKKISQHKSAEDALNGKALKEYLRHCNNL